MYAIEDCREDTLEIALNALEESMHAKLDILPDSFSLHRLVLTADITMDGRELYQLMQLNQGTVITKHMVITALKRLQKKQKFDRALIVSNKVDEGYELKIHLGAFWTLAKVYIEGSMIGKDRYRQHYQGEPGEPFDERKHKHGLERITLLLKEDGYLNPRITERIDYDKATKSVMVTIYLDPGPLFFIYDVMVELIAPTTSDKSEPERLYAKLQKMVRRALLHASYNKITLDETARTIKNFLVRKGFLDATLELEEFINNAQHRVCLSWTIKLCHKKAFEFIGNHFFTSTQLLDQLLLFGKSLALIPSSLLAEELIAVYKKKGFFDAAITWHEEEERTFFCINEGKRARISRIHINGASACTEKELITTYFLSMFHTTSFDSDMLKQSLDNVVQSYIRNGFWNITIESYDYVPLADESYELTITIHEGRQRWLKKITIEGFQEIVDGNPFLHTGKEPIPFDLYLLQEQRMVLNSYLQEKGLLYAQPHFEQIETDDGIEIVWKVSGNLDPVRFGPTVILGSSSLPSSLILRELAYHEGDIWSKKKLDVSLQRLRALDIFDTVSLYPDQILETETSKTVLLRCFLSDPFEFRTRAGAQIVGRNLTYRGGATYKLGASLVMKNPTNRADCLHMDMDFTRYRRDIAAYYRVPWLGSLPIKTEFRLYSSWYDQPIVVGSDERLYRALHDGFLIEFTQNLPNLQCVMNIGFEWMALQGVSPARARALHFDPHLIDTRIPYVFFEPTLFIDYLNDKVQPTQGSLTVISLKSMFPIDLSCAFFLKMLIEQSLFIPLTGPVVLGLKWRLGHIVHESFRRIMPPERFYLGGVHSLRGYDPDLAPPLSCFTDNQGIRHLIPIGGKSMINGMVEVRFPLVAPLWGVVFTDMGLLMQDMVSTINAHDMIAATGFGLRYATPFGPLSFDIGWKWRTQSPLEHSFAWFLSFGQTF